MLRVLLYEGATKKKVKQGVWGCYYCGEGGKAERRTGVGYSFILQ